MDSLNEVNANDCDELADAWLTCVFSPQALANLETVGVAVDQFVYGYRAADPFIVAYLLAHRQDKRVFPSTEFKTPYIQGFQNYATTNLDVLWYWQQRYGDNYSVLTGRDNGVFILDVDGDQGRATLAELEAVLGPLPRNTWRVISPRVAGGEHVWLRFPEGTVDLRNQQPVTVDGRAFVGLDVRSWHGYAVIPGSRYKLTDLRYQWAPGCAPDETELAECPAEWWQFLPKKVFEEESAPRAPGSGGTRGGYVKHDHDSASRLIGDGYGGFQNPLYKNAIRYFFKRGVDADATPVIRVLREMILAAPKGEGRDVSRYMSGDDLPRIVENARKFVKKVTD